MLRSFIDTLACTIQILSSDYSESNGAIMVLRIYAVLRIYSTGVVYRFFIVQSSASIPNVQWQQHQKNDVCNYLRHDVSTYYYSFIHIVKVSRDCPPASPLNRRDILRMAFLDIFLLPFDWLVKYCDRTGTEIVVCVRLISLQWI